MTPKGFSGFAGTVIIFLTLLTCSALIAAPVSAATKYLGGAPSFSAAVVGVNEFTPGEDVTISIVVKNSGLNQMKQFNSFLIEPEDLPTTAKLVTIGLASAGDAVIIKTDPQMVGDISGSGKTVTVQFLAKISTNATAGEYPLPLSIRYKYPRWVDQNAGDVFEFAYDRAEDTLPVTIRIKPQVKVGVIEAVPEGLSAGSEGYIHLKIENTGPENGEMAVVKLIRNGYSPIIPTDSTLFIGSFPSGGIAECRYKVSVSQDATNQTYPVNVAVSYMNPEGTIVTSLPETVGVPVNAKTVFTVISPVPEIPRGTSRIIEVQYRNDGCVTAYNAQARINPHNPVTITDNNAFLGDLEPGKTAIARFDITSGDSAEPMAYTFDSKIRYRDALGSSLESDTIDLTIQVLPAKTGTVAGLPVSVIIPGSILMIIAAVIGLRIYRDRTRLI
jgi:hypothetical protein